METFLSSVDFHAVNPPTGKRREPSNRVNHIPPPIRGTDSAIAVEAPQPPEALPLSVTLLKVGQEADVVRALDRSGGLPVGGGQKRVLDVIIASAALVLLAPLLALIAFAVKLNMGGPVLYRHRRIGFGGVPFDCLKFRSMVACGDEMFKEYLERNPEAADEWRRKRKLEKDPRVTRLGHLLRKTSLDELPQFFNVLRGEMSLVGPRPVVSQELELYGSLVGDYMRARPGVTGLWQISGRSSLSFDERVALDSIYVREWALVKDVAIIVRTVPAIFKTLHAV